MQLTSIKCNTFYNSFHWKPECVDHFIVTTLLDRNLVKYNVIQWAQNNNDSLSEKPALMISPSAFGVVYKPELIIHIMRGEYPTPIVL